VKGKKLIVFSLAMVLCASIFAGCKPAAAPVKVSANKIPPYGKEVKFDWSKLPEGQKQEYFKFQEPFIYKLLSLKVVEEKDVEVPSREITRKEFIHWLVKSMQLKLVKSGANFTDVTKDMPEFEYIMTAASNGIIDKEGAFKPEEPLLRSDAAIWLVNARGETAKTEAAKIQEPLIPAQDGYDEVPKNAIGAMSLCILPDYQLLQYRWKALDEFRYIRPNDPMFVVEAAYSIFMVNYPPVRGGSLTIGQAQEPKTLFAGLDTMSAMTQITSLLYESSVGGYDEFWGRFPYMVKKIPTQENGLWKINKVVGADGKETVKSMELTWELRKGLKWADGTEITGDDAVFNFNFYNHPSFPTIHSETDFWIDSVTVDPNDPYKIIVKWNTPTLSANGGIGFMPRAYFEKAFNYHLDNFSINDKTYYDPSKDDPKTDKVDESFKSAKFLADEKFILQCTESDIAKNKIDYNKYPMHNGAYKVKKWEQGQTIILEPNENYIFGKPLLDSITFRTIENTDTLLAAAMAGNVDMTLTGLSFDQAKQLEKKGAEIPQKAIFTPSLTWEHLDLNIDNPELADVRVRKALLYSIDRQAIVDNFFGGVQPVANAWLPPKHYAYDDTSITKYEFSKEKAAALFDEAGWKLNPKTGKREKDGKVFTITFMTTAQNKTREQVQAVISSGWKEMGLEVNTKNEQATSFFGTTLRERKFNGAIAAMYAWIMGPDSNLFNMANSKQIPTQANGWSGQNYTGFKNEIADKITLENMKLLDKNKVYDGIKIVQKILTDELPSLPLFFRVDITSCHEAIVNFRPTGTLAPVTWNTPWWYWNK
jgi:peptide/nickel transport system substrate-binding protein